jgi:formate/nitrite transporter FocA (FNT family)
MHVGTDHSSVRNLMVFGVCEPLNHAMQDLTGKFVGIWLPISAFAAVGYEHCIANQFLVSAAFCFEVHELADPR